MPAQMVLKILSKNPLYLDSLNEYNKNNQIKALRILISQQARMSNFAFRRPKADEKTGVIISSVFVIR